MKICAVTEKMPDGWRVRVVESDWRGCVEPGYTLHPNGCFSGEQSRYASRRLAREDIRRYIQCMEGVCVVGSLH